MCGWWWMGWRGGAKARVRWDGMGWEGVEGTVGVLVEGEEEEEDGGKGLEAGSRKWKGKIYGMG